MKRISAIIIDDEPLARANIRQALEPAAHWQVVSELSSSAQALSTIASLQPQVAFVDIQMPGLSGIEIVQQLLTAKPAPLVVFVTAFDQYAIQAFELFAFDYLLKPFDDQRFQQTLSRIEQCLVNTDERQQIHRHQVAYSAQEQPLERLIIRSVGSIRIVNTYDIFWLRASGNYVEVGHRDGVHLQRVQLSFLEKHLDQTQFVRTHRSAIVALAEVSEYRNGNDDNGVVVTRDGSEIPVSSRYREGLFQRLGIA
ncbi:MAG: LytR/AlgR family response regulator transcription factor [Lysobacterales bacterium]